jgi:hypothetical protein
VTGKFITEKKMDALLITSTGEVLAIGDTIQIIPGHEKKPEHAGRTWQITGIAGNNLTLSSGDTDGVFGYSVPDVCKSSIHVLPAEGIERLYE